MASEVTSTALNDLTQAAIAEAHVVVSQTPSLRDFVMRKSLPMGSNAVDFPLYDAFVAASLTEGTDLTNTAVTTSKKTVTPGENGVMVTITDVADMVSTEQIGIDIGRQAGNAILDLMNQDIYALFDGFATAVGSSNTDITEATIIAAVRQLRLAKAKPPYYLPCTPYVMEDLMTIYATNTSITADTVRNSVVNYGEMPPVLGCVPVPIDNLIAGTGAGGIDQADTKTGCFAREAIAYVDGWDIRVEIQRDASMRGYEVVVTAFYGVGERHDLYGVEVLVDNKD